MATMVVGHDRQSHSHTLEVHQTEAFVLGGGNESVGGTQDLPLECLIYETQELDAIRHAQFASLNFQPPAFRPSSEDEQFDGSTFGL